MAFAASSLLDNPQLLAELRRTFEGHVVTLEPKNLSGGTMNQAGGARMNTKLITVGSKWLVTQDAERHKAGEVLEVGKIEPNSTLGTFTTCKDHRHGLGAFLRHDDWAHAVPLRDEAFWACYAPAGEITTDVPSPQPGQVCVWGAEKHWSVWLGVPGGGAILLAKGGPAVGVSTPVGHIVVGLSGGRWRIIQDVRQAEPTPLDKVGYRLANPMLADAAAMGAAAGRSVNEIVRKVLAAGISNVGASMHDAVHPAVHRTNCAGCLQHPAVVGAKATLCEACITKKQLEADTSKSRASGGWRQRLWGITKKQLEADTSKSRASGGWRQRLWERETAAARGALPSSHSIAGGIGIFDLHVPRPKKAWKYPSIDEFDLLPDA